MCKNFHKLSKKRKIISNWIPKMSNKVRKKIN